MGLWNTLGFGRREGAALTFVDLAETGAPVEVLRTGEFTDKHGRDVEVSMKDLDALIANFDEGKAEQEIPVDIDHEKGEAAGWIERLWREGNRLLASVDWNERGRELIGERRYRYLSATIDTARQVLRAVSLVNFPAVKGLAPVELSQALEAGEGGGEMAMWGIIRELQEEEGISDEEVLGLLARASMWIRFGKNFAEAQGLDFVMDVEVEEEDEDAEAAEDWDAWVEETVREFRQQRRDARDTKMSSGKERRCAALSDPILRHLRRWVDAGMAVDKFFGINQDVLGPIDQYSELIEALKADPEAALSELEAADAREVELALTTLDWDPPKRRTRGRTMDAAEALAYRDARERAEEVADSEYFLGLVKLIDEARATGDEIQERAAWDAAKARDRERPHEMWVETVEMGLEAQHGLERTGGDGAGRVSGVTAVAGGDS